MSARWVTLSILVALAIAAYRFYGPEKPKTEDTETPKNENGEEVISEDVEEEVIVEEKNDVEEAIIPKVGKPEYDIEIDEKPEIIATSTVEVNFT